MSGFQVGVPILHDSSLVASNVFGVHKMSNFDQTANSTQSSAFNLPANVAKVEFDPLDPYLQHSNSLQNQAHVPKDEVSWAISDNRIMNWKAWEYAKERICCFKIYLETF